MCIWTWLIKLKSETYLTILWSLFINVIIKELCSFIRNMIIPGIYIPESTKFVIYLFFAIIAPFILYCVARLPFFKSVLSKIVRKTLNDDIFNDVLDLKKGTTLIVYIKNSPYYYLGDFKIRDEHGEDSIIGITHYTIYDKSSNEVIRNGDDFENGSLIVFHLKDIESIEFVYSENSDTWKFLSTNI